ncbi:DUF2232 domain-containing protein [Lentilitoribacter sp. EG35]|uniref:DUF2232 domain-containing protein n=1 Tax=Lentilitoribacter sp. EG35 TaxID=3234192 RepID=UPI00346025C3
MTLNTNSLLIGLLAGVASAILLLASGQPSLLSIFLFAAAALPIFIAGLGWSNQASFTAVTSTFIILAIAASPETALVSTVTTLLPSAWLSHLTTLARSADEVGGPDDKLVWYPFPQIMLHLATLMVFATLMIGWLIDYGPDVVGQVVAAFIDAFNQSGEQPIAIQNIEAMTTTLTKLLPFIQSAMWVIILFTAWYLAGHIVRLSGRSKRPRDDMHTSLRMPSLALIFLGGGLVLMFFDGTISYIGAAIAGGFGAGFMMAGLALFHKNTLGKLWRGAALWTVYVLILLFSIPAIIFAIMGLLEAGKPVPMLVSQKPNESKE